MMMMKRLLRADVASGAPAGSPISRAPVTFVEQVGEMYLHWSVVEADARAVPGARSANCLIFSREDCVHRVWEYPANWLDLDDTELVVLCWHR